MIFVDTSVVIAATTSSNHRQKACIDTLALAETEGVACAVHTLSEMFAVLTRLPLPHRVSPEIALQLVQHASRRFTQVTLTATEHLSAIERFAAAGTAGGMLYDAILLECARKISPRRIYTLNLKHFRQIAPDLASRMREP